MKYDIMPMGGLLEGYTSEVTGLLMTSSGFSGGRSANSTFRSPFTFLFFVIYSIVVFLLLVLDAQSEKNLSQSLFARL